MCMCVCVHALVQIRKDFKRSDVDVVDAAHACHLQDSRNRPEPSDGNRFSSESSFRSRLCKRYSLERKIRDCVNVPCTCHSWYKKIDASEDSLLSRRYRYFTHFVCCTKGRADLCRSGRFLEMPSMASEKQKDESGCPRLAASTTRPRGVCLCRRNIRKNTPLASML